MRKFLVQNTWNAPSVTATNSASVFDIVFSFCAELLEYIAPLPKVITGLTAAPSPSVHGLYLYRRLVHASRMRLP